MFVLWGRVRAGEGHSLKKKGELCWRSFRERGDEELEELGRLQGIWEVGIDEGDLTVFCQTRVVICTLD